MVPVTVPRIPLRHPSLAALLPAKSLYARALSYDRPHNRVKATSFDFVSTFFGSRWPPEPSSTMERLYKEGKKNPTILRSVYEIHKYYMTIFYMYNDILRSSKQTKIYSQFFSWTSRHFFFPDPKFNLTVRIKKKKGRKLKLGIIICSKDIIFNGNIRINLSTNEPHRIDFFFSTI